MKTHTKSGIKIARKGMRFRFEPVIFDRHAGIAPGSIVRVCHGTGVGPAPPPFAYVEMLDGVFVGMVHRNSLQRLEA